MKVSCVLRLTIRLGALAVVLAAAVAVPASPARADLYSIQKDSALYGDLNQNNIPNGGWYFCGPAAAVNSFVYLENAYPGVYGRSLVPDNNPANGAHDQAELIAVAQTVAGVQYMNTKQNLVGAGGGSGTWDDMFIYGKQAYIEAVLPNQTIYAAQLKSTWAWLGRPADETPGILKPAWVQDNTQPDPMFLFNELNDCEDVEILIIDGEWGHYLTVTGLIWNDDGDQLIEGAENAMLFYIDPNSGQPGVSPIGGQINPGDPIRVNYGNFPNAELVMIVSESPVPEPASMAILALGGLAILMRRRALRR